MHNRVSPPLEVRGTFKRGGHTCSSALLSSAVAALLKRRTDREEGAGLGVAPSIDIIPPSEPSDMAIDKGVSTIAIDDAGDPSCIIAIDLAAEAGVVAVPIAAGTEVVAEFRDDDGGGGGSALSDTVQMGCGPTYTTRRPLGCSTSQSSSASSPPRELVRTKGVRRVATTPTACSAESVKGTVAPPCVEGRCQQRRQRFRRARGGTWRGDTIEKHDRASCGSGLTTTVGAIVSYLESQLKPWAPEPVAAVQNNRGKARTHPPVSAGGLGRVASRIYLRVR